jgi:hypothetical protein
MATKPIKPVSDFSERCDGPNSRGKWLGISRLTRVPDAGWPVREACQFHVLPEEKAAGQKIIAAYREQEALAEQHNADGRQREMDALGNGGGVHGFERSRLRKEIEQCDRETFLGAQQRMTELREAAIALAKPIFERLVTEFDKELNATAIAREAELGKMGLAIYSDKLDQRGVQVREFALHVDPVINGWQARREIARSTAITLNHRNSIGATQYLCSDETGPFPFSWLA